MTTGPTTRSVTKAVIDGDLILRLSGGDTEIGPMPKGIGLERLRFDGQKVVDLLSLDEMWVENKGGVWILHCIPLPGCQRVKMTYADRWRLTENAGTYRVMTEEEQAQIEARANAKSRNEFLLQSILDETDHSILLDGIKLLYAFIIAQREPNAQLGAWLDSQIPDMKATFQWTAAERQRFEGLIDKLKARMEKYYADQG